MDQAKPKQIWVCGDCSEEWNDKVEARLCCAPLAKEAWACASCDKSHSLKDDAESCCNRYGLLACPSCLRTYGASHINHFAITVAGHCNTCNPFYTLEQQFTIEKLHDAVATWNSAPLM